VTALRGPQAIAPRRVALAAMLAATLLACATPGATEVNNAAPVAAPEPSRLAAARSLLDQLVPPDKREAMIEAIITPMMANIRQAVAQSPSLAGLMRDNPRAAAAIDRFMTREHERSMTLLRRELPAMFDAMVQAYARRFTVAQMAEIERFFATPTGSLYMTEAATIMSDPAVAAWQRNLMEASLASIPREMEALANELRDAAATNNAKDNDAPQSPPAT